MAIGKKTGGRDFQPGQSGNPAGRPPLPEDIKAARKLTKLELERIINKLIYMTVPQLEAHAEHPATTAIERMICSIVIAASDKGDQMRLDFILNRLIGKVKEQLEVSTPKPFVVEYPDGSKTVIGTKTEEEPE